MTDLSNSQKPSLLFLLSDDYGEICNLIYFLEGQPFAKDCQILLHSRLYTTNRYGLPGKVYKWDSFSDIVSKVKELSPQPTIVFLFTGYLYCSNELFTIEEFKTLLDLFNTLGCHIVTDDPFLGLITTLKKSEIHLSYDRDVLANQLSIEAKRVEELMQQRLEEAREWFLQVWNAVFQLLKDKPHLYTYPSDQLKSNADTTCVTFYNPVMTQLPDKIVKRSTPSTRPHWLFVISKVELETQCRSQSEREFVSFLIQKFKETLQAGRKPILIAPQDLIDTITRVLPSTQGIELIPFCPFKLFLSLLLEAEYVFSWNMLSNSLLLRNVNHLPVFLYDPGHMVSFFDPLYGLAVDHYYQGCQPTILDKTKPLTDADLLEHRGIKPHSLDTLIARLKQSPTPQQVVEQIISSSN